MIIDSDSVGDPARFRTLADLESGLRSLPSAPSDRGRLALIVRRTARGVRETPDRVLLTPEGGVPGDAWSRKEGATLDSQVTVMEAGVAELIANGQPLALFGDNVFLELDLSTTNLPLGSRVAIGGALLEVTLKMHKGCRKFSARFGDDALRFLATPESRARRLRGLYLRVLEAGDVGPGDVVEVVARASLPEEAPVL